jgi:hypothetical protein
MAAGDSDVSICNGALAHLGEDPIVARTDNTKRANLCAQFYDRVRRSVLRSHPWRCAKKRDALPALSVAPLFGYAHAYQKPSDYLRAMDLPEDDMPRWEIEGDTILSGEGAPLNIVYVYDLQDASRMDPLLVEIIELELADYMCMPLTQSVNKQQAIQQKLARKKAEARSVSAQEASVREFDEDLWLGSRA